jgi:hypothetical protein
MAGRGESRAGWGNISTRRSWWRFVQPSISDVDSAARGEVAAGALELVLPAGIERRLPEFPCARPRR